jgi:hypothetical protein
MVDGEYGIQSFSLLLRMAAILYLQMINNKHVPNSKPLLLDNKFRMPLLTTTLKFVEIWSDFILCLHTAKPGRY